MAGEKKPVIVFTNDSEEPELMYKIYYAITNNIFELIDIIKNIP